MAVFVETRYGKYGEAGRPGDFRPGPIHTGNQQSAGARHEQGIQQIAGMFRPKLRYAHQGGMNPPVIVIHGNSLEHVTDAYKRFLEGRFRKEFNLVGTPMRIEMKTSHNPFTDKD